MFIRAHLIEGHILGLLLPLADSLQLRDVLTAEEADQADAVREVVLARAEDEQMLKQLSNDYTDRIIDRATYLKQSQRLRDRIEASTARIASLTGQSALDRLGGGVVAHWEQMSAEDRRLVLLSMVDAVEVASNGHAHHGEYRALMYQKILRSLRR